jgi:uncharacterized spore protein YtfJ
VFGEPIRSGDTVAFPVARVRWGFGGGGASAVEQASGSGGGGAASDPAGYILIREDGAQFHPISRPWSILTGAVAAAIVLRALDRLLR